MTLETLAAAVDRPINKQSVEQAWPDPVPLPINLLPVPNFDPYLLPTETQAWAVDIAELKQCPLDLVAIPVMIGLSSLVGRRVGIRPQAKTSWCEAGNLWGAIIARPGAMKSPAARDALSPIYALEQLASETNARRQEKYAEESWLYKIQKDEAERAAKAALRDKENPTEINRFNALDCLRLASEPPTPALLRHVTNDATPEKLGEICRDNPFGLLMHRDEILTMLIDLDQEEKASGRGFLMAGWTGLDGYKVDRISRGSVPISAVNLALFGTAQPSRFASYVRDSLRHRDDGFVQRLQLVTWPDFDPTWVNHDRDADEDARNRAFACYERLSSLSAEAVEATMPFADGPSQIPYLRFTPDAQREFDGWRAELELKVRHHDISPTLASHFTKYRGLIPRLALVCHLAGDGVGPVGIDPLMQALGWAEYLEAHARRIYASAEVCDGATAGLIVNRIKRGQVSASFTARDIYRPGWSGLKDRTEVESALRLLCDFDWLRAERIPTNGRPMEVFTVNPKVIG
jgi:putative DNA primase/helicase